MNATQGAGALALAAASAALGWALHAPGRPGAPADVPATDTRPASLSPLAWPQPAPQAGTDGADRADGTDGTATVRLHEDGSASVQVSRRPPQWILDELCRQGAALRPTACGGATKAAAGDAAALARVLRDGGEGERYDALVQSRTAGVLVAEDDLMRLMAQGPSERVRLAAFDSLIELKSGELDQLRGALQAVLRIPYTPLQARAREQLDGIDRFYDQGTAPQQTGRP